MKIYRLHLLLLLSLFSLMANAQENNAKAQVQKEMENFYSLMRTATLEWIPYLSEDATAVHNGQFMDHETFVEAEKVFFNSLEKVEITILTEPIIHMLGNDAATVTQKHSVNTWYKTGESEMGTEQMMTFIWNRRNGKWKLVQAVFTTL